MISVGIDVSKSKSTACMMKPGGEVLPAPFEVLHTKNDLLSLVQTINQLHKIYIFNFAVENIYFNGFLCYSSFSA